jgi:polyphosphate kinase
MKVHAKMCIIKKREFNKTKQYGFIGTGNFNEKTAELYGDHFLLTSNRYILADINRIFAYLLSPLGKLDSLKACKVVPVAPVNMRRFFLNEINRQIRTVKKKKDASVTVKLNSLTDQVLILKLYEAAKAGVKVQLIIRGVCCVYAEYKSLKDKIKAISIVDHYLEHARVFIFESGKKSTVYISSGDWMVRNLDHRIEAACQINDSEIKQELTDMLNIQLSENVKGRIIDEQQLNQYVQRDPEEPMVRSQSSIYQYLKNKSYQP